MRVFWSTSRAVTSPGLLCLALPLAAALPAAARQATVTGRVSAQESGAPRPESRVLVVGAAIFTSTNAEGRYALRGVPAGPVVVRVLRVGYNEQKRSLTVAAGQ